VARRPRPELRAVASQRWWGAKKDAVVDVVVEKILRQWIRPRGLIDLGSVGGGAMLTTIVRWAICTVDSAFSGGDWTQRTLLVSAAILLQIE